MDLDFGELRSPLPRTFRARQCSGKNDDLLITPQYIVDEMMSCMSGGIFVCSVARTSEFGMLTQPKYAL